MIIIMMIHCIQSRGLEKICQCVRGIDYKNYIRACPGDGRAPQLPSVSGRFVVTRAVRALTAISIKNTVFFISLPGAGVVI